MASRARDLSVSGWSRALGVEVQVNANNAGRLSENAPRVAGQRRPERREEKEMIAITGSPEPWTIS